jgi:hypothetical protein
MYMKIFVTNTQGNICTLTVDSDSTIDMVKRMLLDVLQDADPDYIAWLDKQAPASGAFNKLILTLRGNKLEDNRQLKFYRSDKESTLLLLLNSDPYRSCKHCGAIKDQDRLVLESYHRKRLRVQFRGGEEEEDRRRRRGGGGEDKEGSEEEKVSTPVEQHTGKDKRNMCIFPADPVFKRGSDGKCTTCGNDHPWQYRRFHPFDSRKNRFNWAYGFFKTSYQKSVWKKLTSGFVPLAKLKACP